MSFISILFLSVLAFLLVVLVAIVRLWLKGKRQNQEPNEPVSSNLRKYEGGPLGKFAQKNGIIFEVFIKMNQPPIPLNYHDLSNKDKQNIRNQLKGKMLKIYDPHFDTLSSNDNNANKGLLNNESSDQDYFNKFQKIQDKVQKIQDAITNNNFDQEINLLKEEYNKLKSEKQNFGITISQLKVDYDNLEKQRFETESELKILKTKVIFVEFLKTYCEGVISYLTLCDEIYNSAYDYLNRIVQENALHRRTIGLLLLKFESNTKNVPVRQWEVILQDISKTGVSNNSELISLFKQPENEREKEKALKRLLYDEVLTKYSSSILILGEEFKNIGRFIDSQSDLISQCQNKFSKLILDLLSKVKLTGLEPKYVPLFSDFQAYSGKVKDITNQTVSPAYQSIGSLSAKDLVNEVISYGFDCESESINTLTEVILT